MFAFCNCLNICINSDLGQQIDSSCFKLIPIPSITDASYYFESLEFFKSALGPIKGTVSIQHDSLIQTIKLGKWIQTRCLNCDSYVFAVGDDGEMFVNGNLLRNEAKLIEMMKCDNYSMPFKIIVKPMIGLSTKVPSGIIDDSRVKSLFDKLQDFMATQQAQTNAEILRLQMDLNNKREQAQRDFQHITNIINCIDDGTQQSTKSLSNENMSLTPPVTPESTQMTIDDHNMIPQQTKFNKKMNGSTKHGNSVHHNHITKNIDFDDIFEFDGMQQEEDEAKNETDRYHKYSDTEDCSDAEEAIERGRAVRARAATVGAMNVARSAPIKMPQFGTLHAENEERGKKAKEDQHNDIASSIKMLAQSIHAESIFGALPNRSVMRYNTEF